MKAAHLIRVGGAAPPAASRCSARASLRTPSRGDPPRRAVRPRTPVTPIRVTPTLLDLAASTTTSKRGRYTSLRNLRATHRAKPHHAGGGGGKECAARHERSNDWPQGGRAALPLTRTTVTARNLPKVE